MFVPAFVRSVSLCSAFHAKKELLPLLELRTAVASTPRLTGPMDLGTHSDLLSDLRKEWQQWLLENHVPARLCPTRGNPQ